MVDWLSHSSMCCWPHYAGNFKNEHALFGSSVQDVEKTRKCCPQCPACHFRAAQVASPSGERSLWSGQRLGTHPELSTSRRRSERARAARARSPLARRSPRFSHGCSRTGREGKGGGEGERGEPGASEGGRECGSWREGGRAGFIGRGSMQS